MNKKELEKFNNFRPYFFSDKGADDVEEFISYLLAETRQDIKKDLLKIANNGEMEELRREVRDYFEKL